MHRDAFKRRLAFTFTVIILAQNNFLLLLKPFITTAVEYKAVLKLQVDSSLSKNQALIS